MTTSLREVIATVPAGGPDPTRRGRGRAPTRRTLYLAGLLPLLAVLAFSVKVFVMLHHDGAGGDAWDRRDGAAAMEQYAANRSVNVFEPWIAPFDEGDAAFLLADYPRARDLFITALTSVPHEQECTVRINLALAYEAIGDAAARSGVPDDATAAWQNGITALTDGDCPAHAGLGRWQSRDAATVKKRLEDKQHDSSQSRQGGARPDPRQPPPPSAQEQNRLDRLNERNHRGDQQRRDYQNLRQYDEFGDQPEW